MHKLSFGPSRGRLRVLCLGAHSDDLEIGCGGTILQWLATHRHLRISWVVLSASGKRAVEAKQSASALLRGASQVRLVIRDFADGHFPAQYKELKQFFEDLKVVESPDVIMTHRSEDRHQDHRTTSELTWQTWRDHLILEYEIPKYEGDLGQPNFYVPLSARVARHKIDHLSRHFASQRSRKWFSTETFRGLMHLRAIECRSASGFAEGFTARKLVI